MAMQVADRNRTRRALTVLAVVCAVLQLAIAPNVSLGAGRANFALVLAGCVALMVGGRTGVLFGFAAGLFFDLSTTGPIGLMALLSTIASYLLGMEVRNRLATEPGRSLSSFSVAACVVTLAYHLMLLAIGDATSFVDVAIVRTVQTTLLTVLGFLPFLLVLSRTRAQSGLSGGSGAHLGSGKR